MASAPDSARIFLAAQVNAEAVAQAQTFKDACRVAGVRWTHPEDLHVTLKFFGGTSFDTIARLTPIVAAVAAATPPFSMAFAGVDFFTPRRKPQILWGRVSVGHEELVDLVSRIDRALEAIGMAREARDYAPHLTLARFPPESLANLREPARTFPFRTSPFPVTAIVILASDLSAPRGAPRYRVLETFALAGTPLADLRQDQI